MDTPPLPRPAPAARAGSGVLDLRRAQASAPPPVLVGQAPAGPVELGAPGARRRWTPSALVSGALGAVAGADRSLLDQAPGRERTKQAALGGVLLGSAAMAGTSAGYAVHVTFHLRPALAVPAALSWALFILTIDRWLVVATPRLARARASIALAAPRVGLALLLGTVMSEPLTLAVFGDEIRTQLTVMSASADSSYTASLARSAQYRDLPAQEREVTRLQTAIATGVTAEAVRRDPAVTAARSSLDDLQRQLTAAQQAVEAEVDGRSTTGVAGAGPSAALKLAARDALAARVAAAQQALTSTTAAVQAQRDAAWTLQRPADAARLRDLTAQVRAGRTAMRSDLAAHRAAAASGGGLLDRMAALRALERSDAGLRLAHLALFALLAALECLPVVFKTLLQLGPPSAYERMAALEDDAAADRLRLRRATERAEAEAFTESTVEAARTRAELTREADATSARAVLDAQLAVTRAQLRRWRAEHGVEPEDTAPPS